VNIFEPELESFLAGRREPVFSSIPDESRAGGFLA
jgi:hypothetical protein